MQSSLRAYSKRTFKDIQFYQPPNCFGKLQKLKSIVFAVNYNFPHYNSTSLISSLYEPIFGKVMFCGERNNAIQNLYDTPLNLNRKGSQGYMCLNLAMRLYPDFEGYLYTNDDVIINWWRILDLDISKIWLGAPFFPYEKYDHYVFGKEPTNPSWWPWKSENADKCCIESINATKLFAETKRGYSLGMASYMDNYYKMSNGNNMCFISWSDVFYVPKQYKNVYVAVSDIWGSKKAYLETAVPTMLAFIIDTTAQNYVQLDGDYFVMKTGYKSAYYEGRSFYEYYDFNKTFVHPFKLEKEPMRKANVNFFKSIVKGHSDLVLKYCSTR